MRALVGNAMSSPDKQERPWVFRTKRLLWLLAFSIIGFRFWACAPEPKKHDIRGWEPGFSQEDVLKRLESMHCTTNGNSDSDGRLGKQNRLTSKRTAK